MIMLENCKFKPSPPASVEIKMLVLVLNSCSASLRSSMLMLPFRTETLKPLFSSKFFRYFCVPTNSVKMIIFWSRPSLRISSMVSTSRSTFTSGCWNSACFATEMICSSSRISSDIFKDIASRASATSSSISILAKSDSVKEPILVFWAFNASKRRSRL